MTGGRGENLPLYGECVSCGSPHGVIFFHARGCIRAEHYCPHCAQRYALYSAAYDQLEAQVRGVVEAWLSAWGTLPGVIDLEEQLLQIGAKVEADYKAGTFPAEGVQAFPLADAAD